MQLRDFTKCTTFSGIDIIQDGLIVRLDNLNYKITEDEADGYRSYLNEVVEVKHINNEFDPVNVVCTYLDDGYREVVTIFDAKNNLEIIKFGTENYDDYYPMCVINYTPQNMNVNQEA